MKSLKSESADILVSQMFMAYSYVASECDGHWWSHIVQDGIVCPV
jgi:hypothetical protein